MTDEKLRIKVAELCGWTNIQPCDNATCHEDEIGCGFVGTSPLCKQRGGSYTCPIPYYLDDLNAMCEAEKVMTREQQRKYTKLLSPKYTKNLSATWCILHASARERAEAFVKAME